MFHIIHGGYPRLWDELHALVREHPGTYLCSTNRPDGVAPEHWCEKLSPLHSLNADGTLSGDRLADAVQRALEAGRARVMVDELNLRSRAAVAVCAARLRERFPAGAGRWGAFIVHGPAVSYVNLNREGNALDELLRADAILASEMYPRQSLLAAQEAPDNWLAAFYAGGSAGVHTFPPRLAWLWERRRELRSASRCTVVLGVTDFYMDRPHEGPEFLERVLRIWAARPEVGAFLLAANGGVGSYKWDGSPTPHRMSDPARAAAFVRAWRRVGIPG